MVRHRICRCLFMYGILHPSAKNNIHQFGNQKLFYASGVSKANAKTSVDRNILLCSYR